MKIFLTGGTGFVGGCLCGHLLKRLATGDTIYCLQRRPVPWSDSRVKRLDGSLADIRRFQAELTDSDYVFHLAANASYYGNEADYTAANLTPVREMIALLSESRNLKNFVFVSTIGAVDRAADDRCAAPLSIASCPNPRSPYGRSKLQAEESLRAGRIPYTIVRPAWVYGARMRASSHLSALASAVLDRKLMVRVNYPGRVSIIHVDDLAAALTACIDNPQAIGKTYFAETECLSLGRILSILHEKIHGRAIRQFPLPRFQAIVSRLHARLPLAVANLFLDYLCASDPDFRRDLLPGETRQFQTAAADMLRFHPRLSGRWVITGANSGIGLALARKLAAQNRPLVLIDKTISNVQSFPNAIVHQMDLSKADEIDRLAATLAEHPIAVLANNAGVGHRKRFDETAMEDIDAAVAVNTLAPMRLTKRLLPKLIREESAIVNVASSVAYSPLPGMALYAASKAALASWSDALSHELRRTNLVITFSPSGTNTEFQRQAGVRNENGRGLLHPDHVADCLIRAVRSKRRSVIVGIKGQVLVGVSRLLPRTLATALWAKLFSSCR